MPNLTTSQENINYRKPVLFNTEIACQAPLSRGFSRQEYWSGLPFPSPEALPGIERASPAWQTDSLSLGHRRNF